MSKLVENHDGKLKYRFKYQDGSDRRRDTYSTYRTVNLEDLKRNGEYVKETPNYNFHPEHVEPMEAFLTGEYTPSMNRNNIEE